MPNTLITTEKVTYLFADPGSRTALVLGVVSALAFLYFFISTIRLIALRKKQKKELRAVSDDYKKAKLKARGEKEEKKKEKEKAKKEKRASQKDKAGNTAAEKISAAANNTPEVKTTETLSQEHTAEEPAQTESTPMEQTEINTNPSAFIEPDYTGSKDQDDQKGEA